MLQFCLSQNNNDIPFTFRTTGIRVYSFEEALYHIYHHWRESVDDFLSNEMITWVSELGLSFIASGMKEIAKIGNYSAQVLKFFQLTDYFGQAEVNSITTQLQAWEARAEWEKLKERADTLVNRGQPGMAIPMYKRAIAHEIGSTILNNIGVAHLQIHAFADALPYFRQAHSLEPDNANIALHYAEAAILANEPQLAATALAAAESLAPHSHTIQYLHGLLAHQNQQYNQAISFYLKAYEIEANPLYTYKIAEAHKAMRQYKQALDTLTTIPEKDATHYLKEAEVHASAGDTSAALRCVKEATQKFENNPRLLAALAMYYRKDYNWAMAEEAIQKAISQNPSNDTVRLEHARIKKGLGKTREYQNDLAAILKNFKEQYRSSV